MRRLQVAVVGFGNMGRHHANVYATLPTTKLCAIIDPLPQARRVAMLNHAVPTYETLEDALAHEKLDAVSIVAPTSLHYVLARTCLDAGLHVMIEKPVATQVGQARHLACLSRELGLVVQVGHITRFYHTVQLLQNRVHKPHLIDAHRLTSNARIQDVGVILDLMIHDIDIVLRLVPEPICDLSIQARYDLGTPCEDFAVAQIIFEGGCIARFVASRVAHNSQRTLEVTEPHQTLKLDFGKDPHTEIEVHTSGQETGNTSARTKAKLSPVENHVEVHRTVVHEDNPLRKQLQHFVSRIHYAEAPIGTLEDDVRSLEVATQMLEMIKASRPAVYTGLTQVV